MEKFNVNEYESFKHKNKLEDTLKDGSIISYIELKNIIQKRTKEKNSPYIHYKQYFKDNFNLSSEMECFYTMPIGIKKDYDHLGNLIKETNYETTFAFSVNQLSEKIKKTYNIDIYHDKDFGIDRYTENPMHSYYIITKKLAMGRSSTRVIHIDGKTGEVIFDAIVPYTYKE